MFALSLQAWISIVGLGLSSCTSDEFAHSQSAQDKTMNQKWCEKNYVEAKDCEKWVADQLARKEARHMDNKNRREARLADDEARKEARKTEEKSHAAVRKADNEAPKTEKAVQVDASKDKSSVGKGISSQSEAIMMIAEAASTNKTINMKLCQREHVEAQECEKWVADQLARQAARRADNKARKEAREADDEARKEARQADEKARKAAREEDDTSRKSAREAADEAPKQTAQGQKTSVEGLDQHGMGDKDAPSPAVPMMLVLASGARNNTRDEKWCEKNSVAARDCEKWVADQLARHAARQADNKARKEAREADDEARKEARQANEKARKAARKEDDASQKSAHVAEKEPLKQSGNGQKDSAEASEQPGMDDTAAPSPAVPMMLVADQLSRHAARQADNKARKEVRDEDDEARKEARQADEKARKEARAADNDARKEARQADENARKADHISHKLAHEAHERSQNATAGEGKLVNPQVNTLLSIEALSAHSGLQTFTLLGLASLVLFTVPAIVRSVACRLRTRSSISAPLLEESNLDV